MKNIIIDWRNLTCKNFIICLSDEERELTEYDSGSNNMRLSGYV